MLRKFATASIIEARMGSDEGFAKNSHRAVFNYAPREGYLYVRSRAISSRCNDNFDAFPADEIEKSYLTFIGKPVFVNHHNEDHRRARGVIIDAALHKDRNPDGSPDTWAEVLMEVDAVKFPKLAKAILTGEVDRTSMGCDVQLSKCSACGNEATSPLEYCAHIPGKKGKKLYKVDPHTGEKTAQLVFEICSGLSFFENSLLVEAPADPTAYFLGNVEVGPGLEHLTAGIGKTASKEHVDRWVAQHSPEEYKRDYNKGWARSRNVHCTDPDYHENCPTAKGFNRTAHLIREGDDGLVPKTGKIWELLHEAAVSGDDLFDWDFRTTASRAEWVDDETGLRVTAATKEETDDWHRDHTAHPKNIVDLFNFALDHNYHKEIPKMENHPAAVHEGLNWYPGMHAVGESMAEAAHPSLKVNAQGKQDHDLTRHRVYGTLAVYSEGTDVPMNYHEAALATRSGKPLWSKDTGLSTEDQVREFGHVKDYEKGSPTKGQMVPGKPKSMEEQAKKVGLLYSPDFHHMHEVVKAAKTANYGSLGMHGGDEPGTKYGIDQILSGHGKGGRVVIDRHALSAAAGHRIDGVDFNAAGLSHYQKPTKHNPSPFSHLETEYGNDENKHYALVGDAYRVAAAHLSQRHGHQFTPSQVQAVTWGVQKHLNGSGLLSAPKLSSRKSSWKNSDEDLWRGVVNAKHGWVNDALNESENRTRSFRDRPNDRNINNWERHLERNPDIGNPINEHFNGNGRFHWGQKLAYGETKAPQDVDTLRSENCTVCGNSSAWDGTQCQVCGYVAPPRPFGDPNTDIAQQQDLRKNVLDGDQADPNNPNQQLGQQVGNPEEVQDQEDETAAGDNTQLQQLTCQNCGTGITPTAPEAEDGEPPYPAEGDVCPVCKKGELVGDADESQLDEDAEEKNDPDQYDDDGDEDATDEKSERSDDDDADDDDAFSPKKKAASFRPIWWKPSWWRN